MNLKLNISENIKIIKERLPIENSFDVIGREFRIGKRDSYLVFIDGFAKDDIMLWILETLQNLDENEIKVDTIETLLKNKIGYLEVEKFTDIAQMETSVLSGALALVIDKEETGIIIDAREYPVRGPQEPDLEKVTRGPRDGLVETIIFNTALIRRRVRDPKLTFEITNVGKRSKTDVVYAYIDDLVDKELLNEVKEKVDKIDIPSLIMAEKTLDELIIKKKWYNPLPQVRFTERPDVVAAHLLEGHMAIIVDTSPSVMLLPTTIFHFTQHAEDYYQSPIAGTYIRWIRFLGMFSALFLIPLWLLLVNNRELLPSYLQFLGTKETSTIPIFVQFLLLEFGLDILKVSSIHTPSTLSTSLGIIGGLILSQFAVSVGFFVPETVLYMSVAAIGTFATPSIEFAQAIRIFRLFLLILTGFFGNIGFIVGILTLLIIIFTTKTFESGPKYTWPLFPFDWHALSNVLFRKPILQIKKKK